MRTTGSLSGSSIVPIGRTSASAIAWRFKGELRVTVIAKATFAFADDAGARRVDPQPIVQGDIHHANNPMRSVRFASDLAPYRRRADVLFTGHAYPPPGGNVESATVRLGVASGARVLLDKVLIVRKPGGFQRIPLLYEHTIGGPDHPENPFGEEEGSSELTIFDLDDPKRVAGFGPIAASMPSRRRLLGPAGHVGGDPGPAGITVIPDSFDFDFFQVAPADQQIGFLRGDEWLLLENLNASRPTMRMYLPGAQGLARIFGLSPHGIPEGRPLAMSADMLHVAGEEERISITWRGTFALASEAALSALRIVTGVEQHDEPLVWPDSAQIAQIAPPPAHHAAAAPPASSPTSTLELSDSDILAVSVHDSRRGLAATIGLPEVHPVDDRAHAPKVSRGADHAGSAGETLPIPSSVARADGRPSLPFGPAPVRSIGEQLAGTSARQSLLRSRPTRRQGADETLPIASEVTKAPWPDVLPFGVVTVGATPKPVVSVDESPARPQVSSQASSQAHSAEENAIVVARAEPVTMGETPKPPAQPAPAVAEIAAVTDAPEKKPGSPWAPVPEAPPPSPRAPEKKLPPKVDVKHKLYGSKKA